MNKISIKNKTNELRNQDLKHRPFNVTTISSYCFILLDTVRSSTCSALL